MTDRQYFEKSSKINGTRYDILLHAVATGFAPASAGLWRALGSALKRSDLNSLEEWDWLTPLRTLVTWFLIGGTSILLYTVIAVPAALMEPGAVLRIPYCILLYLHDAGAPTALAGMSLSRLRTLGDFVRGRWPLRRSLIAYWDSATMPHRASARWHAR